MCVVKKNAQGQALFEGQLEEAEDGLFTLVLLHGLTDAWHLLRDHTQLFRSTREGAKGDKRGSRTSYRGARVDSGAQERKKENLR